MHGFRKEAIPARRTDVVDKVILSRQLGPWVAFYILGSTLVAVLLISFSFDYKKKARLQGVLVPTQGIARIVAPASGFVIYKRLEEGVLVQRGDKIAEIRTDKSVGDSTSQVAGWTAILDKEGSLKNEIERDSLMQKSKMRTATDALSNFEEQYSVLVEQLKSEQRQLLASEQQVAQFTELKRVGYISSAQLNDKLELLSNQRSKMENVRLSMIASRKKVSDAHDDIAALPLLAANAQDAFRIRQSELAHAKSVFNGDATVTVTAPISGTVTSIAARNNQHLQQYQAIATVVPENPTYQIALFASADKVGLIKVGNPVLIRLDSFPHEKYGMVEGVVTEVAGVTQSATEAAFESARFEQPSPPVYRVLVVPKLADFYSRNPGITLRAGLTLEADAILEQRKLYMWAFSAVFAYFAKL